MNKSIYAITILIALISCSDKTVPPNSEMDYSDEQQIINNHSSNDINVQTFDTTQISTEKCRDNKLIERIIQFSKEEPYDYYNSGAINQYYKCSEFPKTELQKFPLLRKKNKGIDSIAIHMDVSNATIWVISNTFENHKILQEEIVLTNKEKEKEKEEYIQKVIDNKKELEAKIRELKQKKEKLKEKKISMKQI